jgi:hypothetical protein
MSEPIKIGIIALSRILDDPRVRRQCETLQDNGFQVFAVGQDDGRTARVSWTVMVNRREKALSERMDATSRKLAQGNWLGRKFPRWVENKVCKALLQFLRRSVLAARAQWCRIQPEYAQTIFWSWNNSFNDLYEKAKPLKHTALRKSNVQANSFRHSRALPRDCRAGPGARARD